MAVEIILSHELCWTHVASGDAISNMFGSSVTKAGSGHLALNASTSVPANTLCK